MKLLAVRFWLLGFMPETESERLATMKKILVTFLSFFAILWMAFPSVSLAQTPPSQTEAYKQSYVPCGTDDINDASGNPVSREVPQPDGTKKIVYGDGVVDNPCGFKDVIEMAKRLITGWILAGVTFATMGFAYA